MSEKMVRIWNSLLREVVMVPRLTEFKKLLKNDLKTYGLLFKQFCMEPGVDNTHASFLTDSSLLLISSAISTFYYSLVYMLIYIRDVPNSNQNQDFVFFILDINSYFHFMFLIAIKVHIYRCYPYFIETDTSFGKADKYWIKVILCFQLRVIYTEPSCS